MKQQEIRNQYSITEIDEINRLGSFTILEEIKKEAHRYMTECFLDGYLATYYLLNFEPKPIDINIDFTQVDIDIENRFNNGEDMSVVFRSQGHRCFIDGQLYSADEIETDNDVIITKTWDATLDEKTRDTHFILHGTEKLLNEYFETYRGKTLTPGNFGIAEEDCNCRCILEFNTYGTSEM